MINSCPIRSASACSGVSLFAFTIAVTVVSNFSAIVRSVSPGFTTYLRCPAGDAGTSVGGMAVGGLAVGSGAAVGASVGAAVGAATVALIAGVAVGVDAAVATNAAVEVTGAVAGCACSTGR